jgi:hypothetical protein
MECVGKITLALNVTDLLNAPCRIPRPTCTWLSDPCMRLTEFGKANSKPKGSRGWLFNAVFLGGVDFASHSVSCKIGFPKDTLLKSQPRFSTQAFANGLA